METTIAAAPSGKRGRKSSVILTDRMCEKRVTERTKIYDRKCPGLYVSITAAGVATFSFKFTDRQTGKQRTGWLGAYSPETFTVEDARSKVYGLKGMGGNALAETFRDQKAKAAQNGKTVSEIIEERINWMKTPVRKPDGEMRPRLEAWENTASHLRRFLGARLGKKLAREVTKNDIATLSNDIVTGKFGKPSVSNARHMRKAASALFNWAAEAGRDYVSASPCINLPKLDAEHARTRVLSEDEIKIFWHGLDDENLMRSWDRRTRLALKFELVTMLRSSELLGAHRDELFDLDGENPRFDVPLKRVKKRRVIQQPLSDLAVEIIKEALRGSNKQFVFASPLGDQPLHRKAMADALRGDKRKGNVRTPGICALLGLKPFTPHDLRRTAATLAGDLGFDDAWIAKCLDHAASTKAEIVVPTVTGKVYNHSKRMKEKRAVLDGVAAELRRIIGRQQDGLRLAA
ncbi:MULTISPECIES: site-specific integrase [unclassified Bradyrhizobium]|uniref:tyrosine-type recombinase/integrase n=1 Tax=unclassified Bradyrhizobium TaxID=2631580 RepID=UPI002478B887|nr:MULTISPECIES: site-specific integrase [unclassified Bradyrhizobium]WGR70184.1 site-specific integrase [Bradyrhizobium sp. ISRA426]WGR82241.1 site-specific integrase [Bradyrhizobium sp. ISRA430]WGR85427.1 site-specific integrase [Bradyrhizobium sp. ISRA432]